MTSPGYYGSKLSELPHDVIRLIIKTDEDTVDAVRQISPRWLAAVHEYIKSRKITISLEFSSWRDTKLQIIHREEDAKILGIDRLKRVPDRSSNDPRDVLSQISSRNMTELLKNACVNKMLSRCWRVNLVRIGYYVITNFEDIEAVTNALRGLAIDKIEIDNIQHIYDDIVDTILSLIRDQTLRHVVFNFSKWSNLSQNIGDAQSLIATVSKLVPSAELVAKSCPCHYENRDEMCVSWEKFRDEYFPNMEISVDQPKYIPANRRRIRIIAENSNKTANG